MISESKKYKIANYEISTFAFSVMGDGKVENQDTFYVFCDGNALLVVVADGLGSAAFSKEGSTKIADVATDILIKTSDYEKVPIEILKQWKTGLEGDINQYDTTIKFIKITDEEVVYGGVGDGWIAFLEDGKLVSLTADNAFSNQTDSILSFNLKDKFTITHCNIETISSGLISTDGFSEDMDKPNGGAMLMDIENALSKDEKSFVKEMSDTLENWPVETNKDDKTVVFLKIKKESLTND